MPWGGVLAAQGRPGLYIGESPFVGFVCEITAHSHGDIQFWCETELRNVFIC